MSKQDDQQEGGDKSAYAKKRNAGNQMYGPGCCAHKVSDAQVQKAHRAAVERGHFGPIRTSDLV